MKKLILSLISATVFFSGACTAFAGDVYKMENGMLIYEKNDNSGTYFVDSNGLPVVRELDEGNRLAGLATLDRCGSSIYGELFYDHEGNFVIEGDMEIKDSKNCKTVTTVSSSVSFYKQ